MWEAELVRAERRPFDLALASAGFELNPFRWTSDDRLSHAEVYFAWSWLCQGEWRRELVRVRTDNVREDGRGVPRPPALRNDDQALLADLQWPAANVALCTYLGLLQGSAYEPDPAKWQIRYCNGSKTQAVVWYEWAHVLRGTGREPHCVSATVHDVVHGTRAVPHNPLGMDACSNLHFSVEYMQALAAWKFPGTTYEGISYEGDRPDIRLEVPDGGTDIQDHAVHWSLPCGRSECWSLREFFDAMPDQLAERDSDAAYEAIAREMEWHVLGVADEAAVAGYREDPGTLADKKWLQLAWAIPKKEAALC